jgi:acyl dehydratase
MTKTSLSVAELQAKVSQEIGSSNWLIVDQKMINTFADVTLDHQFIHIDPVAAAKTPFGTTIAHGFLSLSLLSHFAAEALPGVKGRVMGINYGFDKLRFVTPVTVNSRIRAHFVLGALHVRSATDIQMRYDVRVEIEGKDKPALIAEWLALAVLGENGEK